MPKVHQAAGNNGGRRARGQRVSTTLAEINVVPLVDVMLVLLIIFMVTAPMMQQGLQVNLPQARNSRPVNAQPVYITIPSTFSRTRIVQIGEDQVSVDVLRERVKQAVAMREDKSVFLRMDAKATAQDFFDVTDQLKAAGIDTIGVMTKPRELR